MTSSTTVLEPPAAAPTKLERPIRCDGSESDREDDYLFYEGDSIVYRCTADCFVCGWKDGHPRFPRALMAVTFLMEPSDLQRECGCEDSGHHSGFIFYEGNRIVGHATAACHLTAWKANHDQWPLAGFAGNIAMEPADLYRECQRDLNRRSRR